MKRLFLIPMVLLFVCSGCDKEPMRSPAPSSIQPPPTPIPPLPVNPGFKVYAGDDIWLPLPANFSVLTGYSSNTDFEVESYSWTNLAGPDSFLIENPTSKQTKLSNLKTGTYVFEFTVKLKNGVIGTDKISVHVYNPRIANTNEFVFQNLQWACPMGCSLLIENFDLYIPTGTPIRVYLKNSYSNWTEAFNRWDTKYFFGINNNKFWIYSDYPDNEELPVEVKITF